MTNFERILDFNPGVEYQDKYFYVINVRVYDGGICEY